MLFLLPNIHEKVQWTFSKFHKKFSGFISIYAFCAFFTASAIDTDGSLYGINVA